MRLALFLLSLAVVLPGIVLLRAAMRRTPGLLEILALAPSLGGTFAASTGVLLVCAGQRLSIELVLAAEALLLAPAIVVAASRGARKPARYARALGTEARRRRFEYAVLASLLLAAALAHGRPAEWVLSQGHDAPSYIVQAAYHTRYASAFATDAAPEAYAADFGEARYNLNSTVGPAGPDGVRQFPFPPFFKVLLAIALLLGGLPWALHAPLVLGLMAALCAHLVLARMVRRRAHALIGTALLLGSPLMQQFMRVTMSEVCLLFVVAAGLALLHATDTRTGGAMAGVVLSLALLVRIDGLLVWAGTAAVLAFGVLGGQVIGRPAFRAFGVAFLSGAAGAWALALHTSSHYLLAHLGRIGPWVLPILAATAACYGLALAYGPKLGERRANSAATYATRGAAIVIAMAATYALVARPLWRLATWWRRPDTPMPLWPGEPAGSALVVLGYVTALTTIAGLVGTVWLLWKEPDRWLPWLGAFAAGALVYLDDLRHSPAPYWASRRLLATVLPLCVAGTVFLMDRWARTHTLTRAKAWLLAGLIAANLVAHNARLTIGRGVDYVGAVSSLDALAKTFGPTDVVLVDGALPDAEGLRLGLRYLHGIEAVAPVLSTVSDADLVRFWKKRAVDGRRLHVLPASTEEADRLRRLFAVEQASLQLRFEHWRARGVETHRVALESLRVAGEADQSSSAVRAVAGGSAGAGRPAGSADKGPSNAI